MKGLWTIIKLELRRFWTSAMPYMAGTVFVGLSGYFFCMLLFGTHHADIMPAVASSMFFFLLICIPFLSMRMFVEDRILGTDILLYTAPISVFQIVLGKYIALMITISVFLFATLPMPIALFLLGDPDRGMIFGSYLALFFLSAAVSAIGIWVSGLFQNYVVTAVVSFGVLMFFWVGGALANFGVSIAEKISMPSHMMLLQQGVLAAEDLGYFIVLVFFFLMMTVLGIFVRRGLL